MRTLKQIKADKAEPNYRWIVYLYAPLPGQFEVDRATSLQDALLKVANYDLATGFYGQCTASLYPYSEENWSDAKDFEKSGCPFDYPSKLIEYGPNGDLKVIDA